MRDGADRPVGGLAVRPPAGVELRPAARDDLGAVLRLLDARGSAPKQDVSGAGAWRAWDAYLGSVDAAPFVAVADDEMVGALLLTFRRRLNFATWEAWVPELVVADAFRGRGLGRALLRVAIEEWRLRRAHRLLVETRPDEATGEALLRGMGFEEGMLRFRLSPVRVRDLPTPEGVEIRRLSDADFEAATRLVAEMGPHRVPAPERMDAVGRAFRELVRRPSDGSLLAVVGGTPVGICTVEIREVMQGGSEAWVPDLVVTEAARGRGIGAALLDAALRWAFERGARSAVLESGPDRETAHRLYAAAGFNAAGEVWILHRDR